MNADWHARHPMPRNPTVAERVAWHLIHQEHCSCRPIPPRLLAAIERSRAGGEQRRPARQQSQKRLLRDFLSGGDRRSQAQSNRALARVRADSARVAELAGLAYDEDWLVSMRAIDLLEKLSHEHPEWVAPHKRLFIGALADSDKWEIQLQIVRAVPLFDWTLAERRRVVDILRRGLQHPQKFVKAWSLDSLATFAGHDPKLMPLVRRSLREFERSGSKALAARARRIRERLA